MAWRKITEEDLMSVLTSLEIDAFRKSGNWRNDPVEVLMLNEAALIRSYIRTNGKITMSPDVAEIPQSCISPAVDVIAFKLTVRIGKKPSDGRSEARKTAEQFFEKIGRRWITPEAYGEDETTPTAGPSVQIVQQEPSKFENMDGL